MTGRSPFLRWGFIVLVVFLGGCAGPPTSKPAVTKPSVTQSPVTQPPVTQPITGFPRTWTAGTDTVTVSLFPQGYNPIPFGPNQGAWQGQTYALTSSAPIQLKDVSSGQVLASFPCSGPAGLEMSGGPFLTVRCNTAQGSRGFLVSLPSGQVQTL